MKYVIENCMNGLFWKGPAAGVTESFDEAYRYKKKQAKQLLEGRPNLRLHPAPDAIDKPEPDEKTDSNINVWGGEYTPKMHTFKYIESIDDAAETALACINVGVSTNNDSGERRVTIGLDNNIRSLSIEGARYFAKMLTATADFCEMMNDEL